VSVRVLVRLLVAVAGVFVVSCANNPFLSDTGKPIDTSPDSPLSVLDNLLDAYETQRIDSFEELFLADSFKFYLSPQLVESGISPNVTVNSEQIDTSFVHVSAGTYSYWTYDSEVRSHRRLFDRANSIRVSIEPLYDELDLVYHVDALGDTVGAEVVMRGGEMTLDVPRENEAYIIDIFTIDIDQQVFYMVPVEGLGWLIKKWFDLGTTA
jgi:hypothetical protein